MKKTDYDIVAGFYDKVIGTHNDIQDYVLKKISKHNKKAESILEAGCGTGKNLEGLQSMFKIAGLDVSQKMLSIAREKIPEGKFYKGDIRKFDLGEKFDVIICMYDTVNHLLLFSEWKKFFANAYEHLSKSGIFIFDVNTCFKLTNLSEISPLVYQFDKNFLIVDVKKTSANVFNWNLKIFESNKNNTFILHEVNIKETSFQINKIKAELEKNFFIKNVETEDHKRINGKSERVFFVCVKR